MNRPARIEEIDPPAAIPGGEIVVVCAGYDTSNLRSCRASFSGSRGQLVGASSSRVLAIVPEARNHHRETEVYLESEGTSRAGPARLVVGAKIAGNIHMVANPAFDPDDGSLYLTRSGSRGQKVPNSLLRIDFEGAVHELTGAITNPTGIAFDPSGQMFVTSRADGAVYRLNPFYEAVPFAQNLGIATGLAFDKRGLMYVGDRTGVIYRVNGIGESEEWAHLESSVSAYHMAFGPDGALYITGPTVSSFDIVTRIDADGDSSVFYRGLGRPQGLAFDRAGNLYVAASLSGRRGIVRISRDGKDAKLAVAGMNVVGLAFNASGDMVVATNDAVFSLGLGIRGLLLE